MSKQHEKAYGKMYEKRVYYMETDEKTVSTNSAI